jgi:hypothetical protein
MQKSSA